MTITAPAVGSQATATLIGQVIAKLNKLPEEMDHGTFTVTFSAAATATATVNFSSAFTAAPEVTLDIQPITNNTPIDWGITAITTTSFTYYAKTTAAASASATLTGRYIAAYG